MPRTGPVRRALDAVARDLFGPLLTAAPSADGWRVVGWDAEQGLSLTLEGGGRPLLVELEDRDESRDCYARTSRFNVCARALFEAGSPLSPSERQVVDTAVGVVARREGRLPVIEPAAVSRRAEVREVLVERMLVPEGRGQYYLNPYAGCMIGCPFCYVAERADLSRRLEGRPAVPWGRWVDVKVNAAEVLRREVTRWPAGIVRMSPILTDPYQPVERTYRITRACLEVLASAGFVPVILTRAPRVVEDLDVLRRFPRAAVGFSIPTDDDSVRRRFEPGADPVEERLAALATCREAGLVTFGAVQPMLPMDPERLAAEMGPHLRAVRIDRMHQLERTRSLYEEARCPEAATDAFFAETERALRRAFARHGVAVDDLDDLAGLVGGGVHP
jgi:DNA repair photolyase